MNFKKLLSLLIAIGYLASGFTQPLSFIDATVDSIKAVASHVNPTSDDGWVVSAVVNDSIVQFSKFDYCGKLEWNKWVYAKGSIRNSATAFSSDKIYFTATYSDATRKGVFYVTVTKDGLLTKSRLLSFRDMNFYNNAKFLFSGNNIFMSLNVGNDNDKTRFTVVKFDAQLNPVSTNRISSEKEVHDIALDNDMKFYATMNSNEFLRFDETGKVDYTRRYVTRFDQFGDNIIFENANVFLLGYKIINGLPHFRSVKIAKDGRYINHSEFLSFDSRIPVKAMTDESNIYVISTDTTRSKGKRLMFCSTINNAGNITAHNSNTLFDNAKEIASLDVAYLKDEKNIVSVGVIEDTIFHAKQTAKFENACGDSSILFTVKRDTITTDTLTNDSWVTFNNPSQTDVQDSVVDITLKTTRLCEKFDLKDGEVKLQECRGATVTIGAPDYPNARYNWSSGETTSSIQVVVPATRMLTIKYCDKTIMIMYKIDELAPIVPNPVNYPDNCPSTPLTLNAQASPAHRTLTLLWDDGSKNGSVNSMYADQNNVTLKRKVTISYCKDVPGSQEIKFEQEHVYKTNNCFEAKFPNVVSINSEIPENREFKVYIDTANIDKVATFNLIVYNRWGQKVYESNNYNVGWNLQYKNEPAAIDTYIYYCEIKQKSGIISTINIFPLFSGQSNFLINRIIRTSWKSNFTSRCEFVFI